MGVMQDGDSIVVIGHGEGKDRRSGQVYALCRRKKLRTKKETKKRQE